MASKGNSPYSTSFASKNIKYDLDPAEQMRKYKKEEANAVPKNTLPYELGNLPIHFGEIIDNGIQICKTLDDVLRTPEYEKAKDLFKLKENTEKIILYLLQNVDHVLEQYTIGTKHAKDEKEDEED